MSAKYTWLWFAVALLCVRCSSSDDSASAGAGGTCNPTQAALNQQTANPISYMSSDNNGLTLLFNYPSGGHGSNVLGYAVFGIGTETNNTPGSSANIPTATYNTLPADPNINDSCYSYFNSSWSGNSICGFIDSGSQALIFPNSTSAPISYDSNTSDQDYQYYTPGASTNYSATNVGYGGAPSVSTSFTLENILSYKATSNVYAKWGVLDSSGPVSGQFDWGLPFFLGRPVFVGLEGTTSTLGTGIYWSYPSAQNTATAFTAPTGSNVMPVTIGGYGNEPVVTVTVCVPGTQTCVSIPNILLDTGSSGLRLFASTVPSNFLSQLSGNGLFECVSYGDNSVQWGAVQTADIKMGAQTASSVPIHIVSNNYGDNGASCYANLASLYEQNSYVSITCPSSTTPNQSADPSNPYFGCPYFDSTNSNYNGILGVNFMAQDCGPTCVSNPTYLYYSCQ